MGRGQSMVICAFEEIKETLPFTLKGIDSDLSACYAQAGNDSGFINWHLKTFCDRENIQFTRGRFYKKDDNAHIEQKNWTHVRKIFGYVRYDSWQVMKAMNDLYRNELCWFQNLFLPSVKLVKKVHIGSKVKRIYEVPKTPFQRVCECKEADPRKLAQLKKFFRTLDPFELSRRIEEKLERIYEMAFKIDTFQRRTVIPKIHHVNKRENEAKRENYDYSYGYILK